MLTCLRAANTGITGVAFSIVGSKYLAMQSTSVGDNAKIEVKDGTANAALGFSSGQVSTGTGTYKNNKIAIAFDALPAPRDNMEYLDFSSLEDEIHAFYKQSGTIKEFSRTSAILMHNKRHEYVEPRQLQHQFSTVLIT
jgi:hypothetical protein